MEWKLQKTQAKCLAGLSPLPAKLANKQSLFVGPVITLNVQFDHQNTEYCE